MTPERWEKVAQLFDGAVALAPDRRAAFLDEACAGDDSLRREVEALLTSDRADDSELEEIASGLAVDWMAESDGPELIGQTLGHYQVLALLGAGGMGEVYLAQDTTLDRKVALKLLPRKFTQDRDRLRRFEQEARAASALNHPNIITIYEIGESGGARFMAAEYVEGETLRMETGQSHRDVSEVLDIGIQVSGALAAAHSAGIIHRDIKPANLMLRRDGYVKVLDFGLAKLTSARAHLDVTEAGRVLGTINYMSPEQAMGRPLDHRTDIFSLGVVLYEIATGQRLFDGNSDAAVYDSILHKEAPPVRECVPVAPAEFDQVLRRALEKDPARRYQTAAELRADLKRLAQQSGTTEAARIAATERRLSRRKRILRWAALTVIAVGLISAAINLGGRFARDKKVADGPVRKSLAVLPFENLSPGPENVHFADGVHGQVLTDVAKISELKVIGRTSVLQYKAAAPRNLREIAQQLGVSHVLEGSVQRVAGKVRVNAQLIDANTDAQLWAETYDSDLADVFALQSNIAKEIARQLHAKLSPTERAEIDRKPTSDLPAFELYTRARTLIELAETVTENSQENLHAAIVLLNEAVRRDPDFVLAYCALQHSHDALYSYGMDHSSARLALGQAAVDAAVRVSPDSGATHHAVAAHFYAQRDYRRAEQAISQARLTLPNDPQMFTLMGYIHRRQGRWEESTRELEKAVELDPRNAYILEQLSSNFHALHDYAGYIAIMDRVVALSPERLGPRVSRTHADLLWRADTKPLRALIETTLKRDPASADSLLHSQLLLAFSDRDFDGIARALAALGDRWYGNDHRKLSRAFGEGILARMKGDTVAAHAHFTTARVAQEQVVRAQPEYGPALSVLALIDAALGRKEDALSEGRRAVELLPVSQDSMTGLAMILNLALIAAWVGENDLALEQLRITLERPAGPQYGHLKLDPMWDPLRSDPRFQEILASLAPKS